MQSNPFMSGDQPFHHLFETLGRLPQSHADAINRNAYQALLDALSVPLNHQGRCVLLRAPRAGHGKTHLLSRIQHHLAPGHEFVPLHVHTGSRIDAASVTDDALRQLGRPLPAAGGLCGLDLIVRRLFSLALQPLVTSGEVPCVDRDGALASLRNRPLETFDFHHPGAVTAHWIRENFPILGPRLALELANLTGVAPRGVGFWVDAMFHFAVTPIEMPGRVDALAAAAYNTSGGGDGASMERLTSLLALLSLLVRVVLVADDLEAFSADESAALRLAAFLGTLRHAADRVDVVISLNNDIWESAFLPRLSAGLADRLSEIVVELEPLTRDQMVALLESRTPGMGVRVLEALGEDLAATHARGVLKAAAAVWHRASRQPSPMASVTLVAPVVQPAAAVTAAAMSAQAVSAPVVSVAVATPPPPPGPAAEFVDSPFHAPAAVEPAAAEVPAEAPAETPADAPTAEAPATPPFEVFEINPQPAVEAIEAAAPDSLVPDNSAGAAPLSTGCEAPTNEIAPQPVVHQLPPDATMTYNPVPEPVWPAPVFEEPAAAICSAPDAPVPAPVLEPASDAPPVWQPPAFHDAPTPPQVEPPPLVGIVETMIPPAPAPAAPSTAAWHEATEPTSPFSEPTAHAPAAPPVWTMHTPEDEPEPVAAAPAPPPVLETPAPVPAPVPEPAPQQAPPVDQDRIEDLLRQFRERYSRPNG